MNKEKELFYQLKNSRYIQKYSEHLADNKKKQCLKILITYLVLKNSMEKYPCPAKVFDIIYIHIFNERKELKKISDVELDIKNKVKKYNVQSYLFFILDILEETLISEEKYFFGVEGIDYEKFIKILEENKLILKKIEAGEYFKKNRILKDVLLVEDNFFKRKLKSSIYENIDRDELNKIPKYLLEVNEDELERIKKKIIDISLKEGKFKTYNFFKGNKIENVSTTREIEDFGDFLSSSLSNIRKNKTLFLKQLLEKEVLKVEKPLKVQSKKRFKIDFYLDNGTLSQEIIIDSRKAIYFNKILSIIFLTDLSYIFSHIKHWNLDISYSFIPILKETSIEENFYFVDVKKIIESLKSFANIENFGEVYTYEKSSFNKFICNTINNGEHIAKNIDKLKSSHERVLLNKYTTLKDLREVSVILLLARNKDEIILKQEEIKSCKILKNKYIFILDTNRKKIYFNKKEYEIKNSYSDLRRDFLNELIVYFGGVS